MSTDEAIYLTLAEIIIAVEQDPRFQHEIKGKRVKK